MPALFLLWANLHIQFVYGLFVVALLVAVNLAQILLQALGFASEFLSPPTLPAKPLIVILALCVVAIVIGPNSYHPYLVVLAYSKPKFAYSIISELQPLSFRLARKLSPPAIRASRVGIPLIGACRRSKE